MALKEKARSALEEECHGEAGGSISPDQIDLGKKDLTLAPASASMLVKKSSLGWCYRP